MINITSPSIHRAISNKRSHDEMENQTLPKTPLPFNLSIIARRSPMQSPQIYAHEATAIINTNRIKNASGRTCRITPMLSENKDHIQGQFSKLYLPVPKTYRVCPSVPNSRIVIKVLKEKRLNGATKKIELSLQQYAFLSAYFKEDENPPIISIYNEKQAKTCGYTIVKKASTTFEKAPWDTTSTVSDLSSEHKMYHDTIVKLIKASQALEKAGLSKLDLRWNNLALDNGVLKLIDYVNIPFDFSNVEDCYAKRLAGNNPHIEKSLSQHEKPKFSEKNLRFDIE